MMPSSHAALISARIDRIPGTPFLWSWIARVSFGGFFEIYEVALTTFMAPALVATGIFHNDAGGIFGLPDLASFAFATFAGLFLGAIGFSWVADKWGRRPIFTFSLIWYAAATLIMGLQDSAVLICLWRFIAAVGIGTEVVAIDSYLSELTPKGLRGRGFAYSKFLQYLAIPIAGILSVLVVKHGFAGIAGWRVLALAPVLGAVAIWFVRAGLPESPRWLAEHGRIEEAEAIVGRLEARTVAALGRDLPEAQVPSVAPGRYSDPAALWAPKLRWRMVMISIASSTGTIAYFGFSNWLPSLLEAQGVSITKSLAYTAAIALAYPLAPLIFILFADRIERKWQIIIGGCLAAFLGVLFTQQSSALGWIVCGILITASNNLTSAATHTYRSELFPTRVRGRAIGLVYSIDRLAAAFNSYIIGFLLITFAVPGVFVFITGALIICSVTVWLFGPRTLARASEEI